MPQQQPIPEHFHTSSTSLCVPQLGLRHPRTPTTATQVVARCKATRPHTQPPSETLTAGHLTRSTPSTPLTATNAPHFTQHAPSGATLPPGGGHITAHHTTTQHIQPSIARQLVYRNRKHRYTALQDAGNTVDTTGTTPATASTPPAAVSAAVCCPPAAAADPSQLTPALVASAPHERAAAAA